MGEPPEAGFRRGKAQKPIKQKNERKPTDDQRMTNGKRTETNGFWLQGEGKGEEER